MTTDTESKMGWPRVTLYNDLHATQTTIIVAPDGWITEAQVRGTRRKLCPRHCGACGALGTHGPQEWIEVARKYGVTRTGFIPDNRISIRVKQAAYNEEE